LLCLRLNHAGVELDGNDFIDVTVHVYL
jgi:hypothetical protein